MELDHEGEGVAVANTCVLKDDVVLEDHVAVLHLQQ